jgi:hypothetical protein
MLKKKFLRIIAVSVAVLVPCIAPNLAKCMNVDNALYWIQLEERTKDFTEKHLLPIQLHVSLCEKREKVPTCTQKRLCWDHRTTCHCNEFIWPSDYERNQKPKSLAFQRLGGRERCKECGPCEKLAYLQSEISPLMGKLVSEKKEYILACGDYYHYSGHDLRNNTTQIINFYYAGIKVADPIKMCVDCKECNENYKILLQKYISEKILSLIPATHNLLQEIPNLKNNDTELKNNMKYTSQRLLSVQEEFKRKNDEVNQKLSFFLQKFEEYQKKSEESEKEFKQHILSLQVENKSLKQLFTNLPSIDNCDLFNMGEEKFLNQTGLSDKINLLYKGVSSYHDFIKNLKQKAKELGLEDVGNENISPSPSQIVLKEAEVPEYCIPLLLKKDPAIFLPWKLSKEVHNLMYESKFLGEVVLDLNILVEEKENKISLISYIQEKKDTKLHMDIFKKGKKTFKKMVSHIETISGNFWENKEEVSTVPVLLKKLNEGNKGEEWVTGWSGCGEDYKKYVAASVLCKRNKGSLPEEYDDIGSYLMDK